jgi:hypothetical protein
VSDESNADLVGKALRVTSAALRPWIEGRVDKWPSDFKGRVEPRDPSYLIWVALNYKPVRLHKELGDSGSLLLQDLRHTRNRWAHHVPFDDLDVVRSLDTCRRILLAVEAEGAAKTIERQIRAVVAGDPDTAVAAPELLPAPPPKPPTRPVASGHRRMRSPSFREEQWARRFDLHVEPINRLVDDLIAEKDGSWMPYIPPYHGGIQAKILLLYQDPGKMTSTEHGGSGFLGCENDDPSARVVAECLDAAGIDQRDVIAWNAYPWFLPEQGGVTTSMIDEGLDPLRRLLELLPGLHTVVTGGNKAHESWRRFSQRFPDLANSYQHLETFHTSGRGITNGGRQTKAEGVAHVTATFAEANR